MAYAIYSQRVASTASCLLFLLLCDQVVLLAQPPALRQSTTQPAVVSEDEEKERVAAARFLEVLLRRPTTGTALDKVFGYHVAKGDLGEVVQKLSDQAATSKDADEAGRHWLLVGLLQLQRGADAAAVKALATAQEQLKTNPLAAFHYGQALLLVGDTEAATAALQIAIDRKPPKAEYLAIGGQLGRLYQRAGKVDEALKVWNELEKAFPSDDGVRQRIAATLAEEGDIQGALSRFDALAKSAKAQNDQMVFAINAADLRIQLGQKEQATRDLEVLLAKLRPSSYLYDEVRRRIEAAFLSSGDYAGLADYYERWVNEHKDDIDAVLRLARTLSVQGRSAEALKWFEQSIERAPTDSAPRLAIIDAYIADGRYADAAKQYEQLVAADANQPDYLVRWGQVLRSDTNQPEAERQQAAAAVWKRLTDAKPKDAAIQTQVADLLRGAKLTEAALSGYRAAIALAPDEPQHKEYLGEYLHQLGRKDEALEVWRSLAAGEQRTRENLVRLSEVLHQFEQSGEALATLAEACTLRPKVHERLRYAEWLRDAQQYDKVLEQLELARGEAETVDERDRVFASAVQTYQAAGQLPQRIDEARKLAEETQAGAGEAGERWRQLAVLYEANRQTQESLEAIDKAVQVAPTNIETLDIAARMFEDAGRLPMAIEKRRLLADSDRRFRNGHLQRLASLYIRSGSIEEAITSGREMLAGAGGSVDAFKFYAELCGQAGREDERIDTLRRCVRLNPRSEVAQALLAGQLAEDFKTEQAIELYWKMLDAASDIEKRRETVNKLTDLYLRSNRLDQLISRLELRGRESGDRRTAIDLVAAAYQQAGDLGLAREALEGLLREGGRDTLLLDRLVGLAEQAGEVEKAIELQRQLLRLAPGRPAEARLASLLIDIGAMEEAQAIWLSFVEKNTDPQQTARSIDRLFAAGESKVAIELARKVLEKSPEDWEMRLRLMVLLATADELENAVTIAKELRAMSIDEATLPVGAKPYAQRITAGGQTYQSPPLKLMRLQSLYELYRLLDERYGYQQNIALPKPMDFGQAKLMAQYVSYKHLQASGGDLKGALAEITQKASAQDASPEAIWEWYEAQSLSASIQQTSGVDFRDPSNWEMLFRLAEMDHLGEVILMDLFSNRLSYAGRSELQIKMLPLSDERLNWLKQKADTPSDSNQSLSPYGSSRNWSTIYGTELRIADRKEEAEKYTQERISKLDGKEDATSLFGNLQYLSSYGSDDQLWAVIEKFLEGSSSPGFRQQFGASPADTVLAIFAQQDRVDKQLSKGAADQLYRQRVMQLLDRMIASDSETTPRRKALRLTGIGEPRSTYKIVNGNYQQLEIAFPPQGLGPEDEFIQAFHSAWQVLKEHSQAWLEHLKSTEAGAKPRQQVAIRLACATLLQWNEKTGEAIDELAAAIKLATVEVPMLEPELRLLLADLLLRQNRKREALAAIESLSVYDQNTMAIREFAAAKLAAAIGDQARAQAAAKRLFGVRLDTETQIELAKLMRSLDMRELASDLVRRMRSRGGSSTNQLQTLMTYFQTQDEKVQAAEVAMELLQRTAPTRSSARSQSRGGTTAEGQLRKTALQTLAASGRLSALIEATEKRLERSPKSQRLRAELVEMYVSAGKVDKASALLGDSTAGNLDSTVALEAAAKQLVTAGKMDQACEAYLKILRRKPQLFQNEFYEIKRPFDQTKRVGDLVDLVLEVGLKKFEGYRIGELCADLLREQKDTARARKLYLAMLSIPPAGGNAMYNLHNVLGNARELLTDKETVEKTVKYLINGSQGSSDQWTTLFQGYSTSSDGRYNNSTTYLVRAISSNAEFLDFTEQALREALKAKPDWHEGQAWLGILLTSRKQYDEAKLLLEPLPTKEMRPQPTYDALWLIGSLIDEHKPMQELAGKMYEYALANTTSNRNSEFQYTLEGRACKLMAEIGQKERARALVLEALERGKKNPQLNRGNDAYDAYQKIRETISVMDFLASLDFPADALRLARELDRSLFAKAGQYQRNQDVEFDKKQKQLLKSVRKLGGVTTAESMINDKATGASAVDFGISLGDRPFSERGLQCLWIDLIEEVEGQAEQAESLGKLVEQLKTLREARNQDDSVYAALAIAADVAGDRTWLRELVATWTNNEATDGSDLKLRRQLLTLALLRLDRGPHGGDSAENRKLIDTGVAASEREWEATERLLFLAELGKQSFARNDRTQGTAMWKSVAAIAHAPQSYLLDLALSATAMELNELSVEVAMAAAKAPAQSAKNGAIASQTGSLGELLGSNRVRNSGSSQNQDEPDAAEVQLAKSVLKLDDSWALKKVDARLIVDPLFVLTSPDSGKIRPLFTEIVAKENNLTLDSVFDRLAKRAHESQRTDEILERVKSDEAAQRLLAVILLLRAERGDEAKLRLEAVEPESLKAVSKELVLQSLMLALNNAPCRRRAVELGLALVEQNKPTQRYGAVQPFDTFSMMLIQRITSNGMRKEYLQAAVGHYLELTQHDNDRYSGSYGFQRRASQLEEIARLFLPKGMNEEALKYLGMRQAVFNMGHDSGNDWTGIWSLENLQSKPDRQSNYKILADWTFDGDGALNNIKAFARRQQLPAWIPESVGGRYPTFPPVAEATLPIATNYYFLAKLAQESSMVADLKQRFTAAVEKERAGAAEGMAIVLAAWKEPIEGELLARIDKRLDSIDPGSDRTVKGPLPLAELQLAALLATDANHAQWAKNTANKVAAHGQQVNRGYVHPWLSRFQYLQGWSESSSLQSSTKLAHWLNSTAASAHDYYEGDTPAIWVTDGDHRIDHVCGFGADFMWLRYPLEGSYEFEVELPSGGWRESEIWCNGLRLGSTASVAIVDVQSDDSRDWARFQTQAIKNNDWNKHSIKMDEHEFQYSINGALVYREQRKTGSPWLALRSAGVRSTSVRNIKILGEPTIPGSVNLINNEQMRGWTGVYYGQSLPTSLLEKTKQPADEKGPSQVRLGTKAEDIAELAWTIKDDELISGQSKSTGPGNQSVVQYQRPLGEGESIAYEFYYEAGKTEVHPAIGRTAIMLRPGGLRLHWMTEPNTSWRTPADFEVPVPGLPESPVPLKNSQWNSMKLELTGVTLTMTLNGERIFEQSLDITPQGVIFGLFHYADKSSVRVRNLRLEGHWPEKLPEKLLSTQ